MPSASAYPLIGSLVHYARDPLGFLQESSRRGDVVFLRFPRYPTYLVSDPTLIDQVLVKQSARFTKDRFSLDLRAVLGQGLLTSEGDFWRRQRRLAQPAFHRDRVAAYGTVMVDAASHTVARWSPGEVRDLHTDLMELTLDIVCRTLFGAAVHGAAESVGPALEAVMARYASVPLVVVPALQSLPLPINTRFRTAVRSLDELVYGIIRRRRAEPIPEDRGDLLGMLLSARDDDGGGMTDTQVRDEVLTVFLAGHETTALALAWTFQLLGDNPAVDARLGEELATVLGDRPATAEDMPRLKYTEAVIQESMRLLPPAWAVGREATESVELGGHRLPAGAQLWMSPYVVHRDPRNFDAPEEFAPSAGWMDCPSDCRGLRTFPLGAARGSVLATCLP